MRKERRREDKRGEKRRKNKKDKEVELVSDISRLRHILKIFAIVFCLDGQHC